MRLTFISHKPCWPIEGGYATDGGFPLQAEAISLLFDETLLILFESVTIAPGGLRPLEGHNLHINLLPEPPGHGCWRKLAFLIWVVPRICRLWAHNSERRCRSRCCSR